MLAMPSPTPGRRTALFAVLALALVTAPAARAQTDYFWNAPTGSTGTWDTVTGSTTVNSGAAVQILGGAAITIAQPITLFGTGIANDGALRNVNDPNLAVNMTWSAAITIGAGGARINSDAGTLTISTGGI